MRTEDFSHKAITNAGHAAAFADIARQTWSGDKQSAGQRGTGEAGARPEGPVTPKSGHEGSPDGAGHAAAHGAERSSAGDKAERPKNGGFEEAKPAGSDASGSPSRMNKPASAGESLSSFKPDHRSDVGGYKLPNLIPH